MAQMSASDAAAAASGGGGGDDGSEGAMGAAARREAAVAAAGFERAAEQAADALVAATGNDLAAATERLLAAHRRAAASLGQQQQQQQQQSPLRSDADVRQAQVKLSKEHKLYSAVAVRLFIPKHLCPFSADSFQTERAIVPFCSGCSRFGETRNEWALPRPTQDRELDLKAMCMRHSLNRLSADCAVLGLLCLRWCANFVLQLQGAGGLDNSNMVGGLQGLVELHASGAEKNQILFLVSLAKCRCVCFVSRACVGKFNRRLSSENCVAAMLFCFVQARWMMSSLPWPSGR